MREAECRVPAGHVASAAVGKKLSATAERIRRTARDEVQGIPAHQRRVSAGHVASAAVGKKLSTTAEKIRRTARDEVQGIPAHHADLEQRAADRSG